MQVSGGGAMEDAGRWLCDTLRNRLIMSFANYLTLIACRPSVHRFELCSSYLPNMNAIHHIFVCHITNIIENILTSVYCVNIC